MRAASAGIDRFLEDLAGYDNHGVRPQHDLAIRAEDGIGLRLREPSHVFLRRFSGAMLFRNVNRADDKLNSGRGQKLAAAWGLGGEHQHRESLHFIEDRCRPCR